MDHERILEELGGLVEPMLQRRLWVCLSRPEGPPQDELAHLADHLRHLVELERSGVLFAAGPFLEGGRPGQEALLIVRADDEAQAREVLDGEPLHRRGLRSYTLHEWQLNEGRVTVSVDFSTQAGGLDGQ